ASIPERMEIVPASSDTETVAAGIAAWQGGGNRCGTMQRLLDIANEVKQIPQAGGLVALSLGVALQRGNALVDRPNDVKCGGSNAICLRPIETEGQING